MASATPSRWRASGLPAITAGLERWEAHLRDGLTRIKTRGKLRKDADPAALTTATMASIQVGLLVTQVRRDTRQLRIALNAARANLRLAAADHGPQRSRSARSQPRLEGPRARAAGTNRLGGAPESAPENRECPDKPELTGPKRLTFGPEDRRSSRRNPSV